MDLALFEARVRSAQARGYQVATLKQSSI